MDTSKARIFPPNDFIPIAEECGLIIPIGEWVLKTACQQTKIWMDAGYGNLSIAINISAKQFQQETFIDTVLKTIKETKVKPSLLELEITENSMMQDTNKNIVILNKLKDMGLKISIDDFGTGFSSLNYIMKFAADILKIDRSFISNLLVSSTNTAITIAIINMAHSLNLKVIAEGVETEEQLKFLKEQNCNEIQGYLFSKPVPPEEFEKMLKEGRML
jgi:EAL domain-containing protein (putative c-di-GMP-specific phosphodiesterase class I)